MVLISTIALLAFLIITAIISCDLYFSSKKISDEPNKRISLKPDTWKDL